MALAWEGACLTHLDRVEWMRSRGRNHTESCRAAVPSLFGIRDQFPGRQFSHRPGKWGRFQNESGTLHLLCTLFLLLLHELHLKSSGLRSRRLGAPEIGDNEKSRTWKNRNQLKGFLPPVLRLHAEAFSKILPLTLCQLLCLWVKLLDFSLCFSSGPKGHSVRVWHFEN